MADTIRKVSVEGLIVAADWDDNDEVALVSLLTDDEGEYLVARSSASRGLIERVHKRVRVVGCLLRDELGENVLEVESFVDVES